MKKAIIKEGKVLVYTGKIEKHLTSHQIRLDDPRLDDWGYKDVEEPNTNVYQRLLSLIPSDYNSSNNKFVHRIYDFTQEEIDNYDQGMLDSDISAIKENKYASDGERTYNRIKHKLRRALDIGFLTLAEFDDIYKPIRKKIVWLNTGDWDIAKENVDAIPAQTGNKKIVLDEIKDIINAYITNNY